MAFRKIIKDSEGGQKYVTEQEEELEFDQVPTKGSFNPVTSDGVAKAIEETSDNITKLFPEGTSEENKLVTESEFKEVTDVIPEDTTGENPLVNESGLETALSEVNTAVESIEGKIPQSASSSNKMVTEQDLQEAQGSWQSGFTPKGESTISALNGLTDQSNGDQYVVTDSGTLTDGSLAVTAGETVAWDGTNSVWYKVNNYALRQFGTDNVKNLPTSISQFRTGDVIPVDGPNGPAKMPASNLQDAILGGPIDEAVQDWLAEHPEATTTVQDSSLTEAKFSNTLKLRAIKDYVTPEMFGAVGDGVTDDTTAFQEAVDSGKPVLLTQYYLLGTITIPNRPTIIVGSNALNTRIYVKPDTDAIFLMNGTRYGLIKNIFFGRDSEASNVYYIKCVGTVGQCVFENLYMSGGGCGIYSTDTFWDNTIRNCRFRRIQKGVYFEGCGGLTFEHVYFNECVVIGVHLNGARRIRFDDCLFDSRDPMAVWAKLQQPCIVVDFNSCDFEVAKMGSNANLFEIGSNSVCYIRNSIIRDVSVNSGATSCALFNIVDDGYLKLEKILTENNNHDIFIRASYGSLTKYVKTDINSLRSLTRNYTVPNIGRTYLLFFDITEPYLFASTDTPPVIPAYTKGATGYLTDIGVPVKWSGSAWLGYDGKPVGYVDKLVNAQPTAISYGNDTAAVRKRYIKFGNIKPILGGKNNGVLWISVGSYAGANLASLVLTINLTRGSSQAFSIGNIVARILPIIDVGGVEIYIVPIIDDESFDLYVYTGINGEDSGAVQVVTLKDFGNNIFTAASTNVSNNDFAALTSYAVSSNIATQNSDGLVPKTNSSGTYTLKSVDGNLQWVPN